MVRVLILGYEHPHVMRYVPELAAHPSCRLAGIVGLEDNMERARSDARSFGCDFYDDPARAIRSGADAVYIASTPARHLELVKEAAGAGLHILCDKPIALDLETADAIIAAARRANVHLMVPFNPRYQRGLMKAREMLAGGQLGDLRIVHAYKTGKLPLWIPNFDCSWFVDPRRGRFGGFADMGVHAIDGLLWLTGQSVRSVHARITTLIHDIPVDDFGTATLEFEDGSIGTLTCGWINPKGLPTFLDARFEVIGSTQTLLIDKPYHDFMIVDDSAVQRQAWWRTDVSSLVHEFVEAVEDKREPGITGEFARKGLEVLLACYRSSAQGQPVALPLAPIR